MSDVLQGVERLRGRLAKLPRESLAHLPTPLDRCPNIFARSGGPELWIKRDDCTGLAFGGNKTRQLEYVLGDAVASGADSVIQGAASQSNHSRQLAAAAAKIGISSYITPRRDAFFERGGGNLTVTRLLATELMPIDADESVTAAKRDLADALRQQGRHPYIAGMGAERALTLAAVAYVAALCEIVEALVRWGNALPTHVYTTSQGSTQAGLQLGVEALGLPIRVIGINPMDSTNEAYIPPGGIRDLMLGAAELLGLHHLEIGRVTNVDAYVGDAYGVPSQASLAAVRRLARTEGILLDPVYSGKGFAGLLDHVEHGELTERDRVVFVHTGGLPALFADFAPAETPAGRVAAEFGTMR